MSESLDVRAKRIIERALDLAGAARERCIEDGCEGDPALRARVMALLVAVEKDDTFLSAPTTDGSSQEHPDGQRAPGERVGDCIGDYKLLESIGEGGFGTVYMAEQVRPVRRRVALKIIKLGMDTRGIVARFEQERQALALMDHPNVAKVLDAGATHTGRPYFAMELVKGRPITAFCDEHALTIPERLALFAQVCRAVQHAHTKGVIHRDIKPANVLVSEQDGRPQSKIIDFGIAKAMQHPLTDKTIFTEFRQFVGTPEYMSPEQAAGSLDIDTRSDVYALGVLLYEMLAGVTPLDGKRLRSAAYGEMQRIIREVEPSPPSTRLAQERETLGSIAATRRIEPRRLGSLLRGELDWIVMRALDKDRARRYDTAGALATDVERYLAGNPVEAAPASVAYRLRKFVHRNRGPVLAGSLVLAALVAGLTAALWQADLASRERDIAKQATEKAEEARMRAERAAAFQASQLRGLNPAEMGTAIREDILRAARAAMDRAGLPASESQENLARLETLLGSVNFTDLALRTLDRQVFERAQTTLASEFGDQPVLKAALLLTLSDTMRELGLVKEAERPLVEGLAIRRRELGDDHEETITAISAMGVLLRALSRLDQAEPLYREALERARRTLGPEHDQTVIAVNNLGLLLYTRGKLAEAEVLVREGVELRRRLNGPEADSTLKAQSNLGLVQFGQGKLVEAEANFRATLAVYRKSKGPDHPDTLILANNLGSVYKTQGRLEEAEPLLREVLDKRRALRGNDHPDTLAAMVNLSVLLREAKRFADAEPLVLEALETRRRKLGSDNLHTLEATYNLGLLRLAQGRSEDAIAPLQETFAGRKARLGAGHAGTTIARFELSKALTGAGRFPEAERLLLESREVMEGAHPGAGRSADRALADLYTAWDKAEPDHGHAAKASALLERLRSGASDSPP
jgi:non-specific serine/threonine protein kinase/serine/threonine-protein kinase